MSGTCFVHVLPANAARAWLERCALRLYHDSGHSLHTKSDGVIGTCIRAACFNNVAKAFCLDHVETRKHVVDIPDPKHVHSISVVVHTEHMPCHICCTYVQHDLHAEHSSHIGMRLVYYGMATAKKVKR